LLNRDYTQKILQQRPIIPHTSTSPKTSLTTLLPSHRNGGHCLPILHSHPHNPAISTFEHTNYLALSTLITSLDISCEWTPQSGIRALYSSSEVTAAEHAIATLRSTNPEIAKLCKVISNTEELEAVGLKVPEAKGAVVTENAARLWPYKLVTSIWERLLADSKLNLQTHTPVLSLTPSGHQWNIHTERGVVEAEKVVLATNAYTSHLLPQMADLIVPCRGQMSALLPGAAFSGSSRTRTNLGFVGPKMDDYLIQRPGPSAHLMFGGGRSYGPSLGISSDEEVDDKVASYLRCALPQLLHSEQKEKAEEAELEATHQWTGIMGFSRDDLPWVGQVPNSAGLFVVAGYTGHGMPNAWLCGKSIASMVLDNNLDTAVEKCVGEGLPRAYLLTEERIALARELDSVEVQDGDHAFRAEEVVEV
jgi:glycine/D-amino acid oxidase-like deaminating enzyme